MKPREGFQITTARGRIVVLPTRCRRNVIAGRTVRVSAIPVEESARPRDRPGPVAHLPLIVGELFLLLLVTALTIMVRRHSGPLPGDVSLERSEQHWLLPHHTVTSALEGISNINWPVPAAITLGVVIVIFLVLRRWLDVLIVLACSIVADEATYVLSQWIHRSRPHGHGLTVAHVLKGTYSFPSGHVVHATAVFGLLLFLSFQIRRSLPAPVMLLIRAVLIGLIVVMGPSRMLEGEHWPSDVLGGLAYGAFWLILFSHVFTWARYRFPRLLARDER